MTRAELEAAVYNALIHRAKLTKELAKGEKSIYHARAPAEAYDRYPFVVYSVISDEPVMVGDNEEIARRVTMRFHIVTDDGEYGGMEAEINEIMSKEFEGVRLRTLPYEEGMLISDYRLLITR